MTNTEQDSTEQDGTGQDIADVTARDEDIRALTARVADLERAQRQESPDDFMALFSAEPVWVTGAGHRLFGWDVIDSFTRKALPGSMPDVLPHYAVVRISFLRPDVAVVNVRQRYTRMDGTPIPGEGEGAPVYVMVRDDGGWLIAAGQNTLVLG